jgi:chorismate dehydratase
LPPKIKDLTKIKVAAVSYLNTKPLLYGIKNHHIINKIELIEDYPAKISQMLIDGEVDLGLVPVAVIPKLNELHIISDYCIGAEGEVASVCIFSEVPIHHVEKVYLDHQSRTSVRLARILLKEYWKKEVEFIYATGDDFRSKIKGTTAGVVIGDRALEQRKHSAFIYDLAAAWKQHTGLPFVFAAWISNKVLPLQFIIDFNTANKEGIESIVHVSKSIKYTDYDLITYFTRNISYELTESKRQGLMLYLEKLKNNNYL